MAQIPLGAPARILPQTGQTQVITTNPEAINRPGQAISGAMQDAGNLALRMQAQQRDEDLALAKVKASNLLIDRESQIKTITSDLGEKMRTGEVPYDKAEEVYQAAVSKLEPVDAPGLDEVSRGGVSNSLKRLQASGVDIIKAHAGQARIGAAQADLVSRMDILGKDAGLPGANIDAINARMDAEDVDVAGRLAFGDSWGSKKQEFKDRNWSTHATQRVMEARDSIGNLQQVEHDLTAADGFYASKLDPEKRNQLLNTVTGRIYQVKEHNERQAEIRENKAMRALDQMDRQAASGVPPTMADQQRWQATVAGTSFAGDFNTRIAEMNEVQGLLRLPLGEQAAYVAKKRQEMAANGASITEQANVNRLATAVDNNVKMLKEQPLQFNAMRTGEDVPALDISGIATPEGQQQIADQIAHRFDVVNAVRKSYGPEVARNPWKPEEQTMLAAFMTNADDATKLKVLGAIAGSAPSGSDYVAAIKPIVGDQPITTLAGIAQFRGLKGDDGTDVPKTLLAGSKVLADKSAPMPSEQKFRASFDEEIGNAIPAGTPQREQAYLAYKSLYAGMAGPAGVVHDGTAAEVDSKLAAKALQLSTGGVTEKGGAKVVKPYGMSDKLFSTLVDTELEGLSQRSGFNVGMLEDMPLSPVPGREGSYFLMNAGRVQIDPATTQPMVVNVGTQAPIARKPANFGKDAKGMIQKGNIDLDARPVVKNADGTISTVRSMSVNFDGKEILIPTVSDDGKIMSDEEAIANFRKTKKHLGIFDNPDDATAYAESLHNDQANQYGSNR